MKISFEKGMKKNKRLVEQVILTEHLVLVKNTVADLQAKSSPHRTDSRHYRLTVWVACFCLSIFFMIACAKSCVVDLGFLKADFHEAKSSANSRRK